QAGLQMHATPGRTAEVSHSDLRLATAEHRGLDYVRNWVPEPRGAPLAGNSIATDRGFIARDMPELDAQLHYRMVDVSSGKELVRRWDPRVYYAKPEEGLAHRALADINESIAELDYYRKTAFVPQPGPTSEQARAVAADKATTASSAQS